MRRLFSTEGSMSRQDKRGRPLCATIEELPESARALPGVWKNKRGPGYRVPFNLYDILGWSHPANRGSEEAVTRLLQSPLLRPGLDQYATDYQRRLLRKLCCISSHGWAPAGSGKTLVGIVALLSIPGPRLIITTAAARGTWEEQIKLYCRGEAKPVILLGQGPPPGFKPDPTPIYITAWETLKYWGPVLARSSWGAIGMDEGHFLRRPRHCRPIVQTDGSVKFQSLENTLSGAMALFPRAQHRFSLTATPIPGRVKDLWVQLHLIEPWQWGNFHSFGLRYCGGTHTGYGYEYNGLTNKYELRSRLRYVREKVQKSELASALPPRRREVRRLEISEQNKALPMKREIQKARKLESSGHAGSLFEAMLCEAATRKHRYVLKRVLTALQSGQKVVVLTSRRKDCEVLAEKARKMLGKKLPQTELWWGHGSTDPSERDQIRRDYMASPGPSLLIGTGDAWGQSINLQDTDLAIITMLPWTPDKVIQWEGRFTRLGQTRPVLVCYVIARETADEHVADLLLDKLPHVGEAGESEEAESLGEALAGIPEPAALLARMSSWL